MAMLVTPEVGGSQQSSTPVKAGDLFSTAFGAVNKVASDYISGVARDFGDHATNYSQTTALAPHLTEESINAYGASQSGGTSAKSSGQYNLSGLLGSSAFANNKSLQAMYEMFQNTGDTAWLEKLIDTYASIENVESARNWEKMMSDSSFSRLIDDIERKGYNPWLALQNGSFGQASSYSTSAASVGNTSPSQQATSRANNLSTVGAKNGQTAMTGVSALLTGILLILRMAAL